MRFYGKPHLPVFRVIEAAPGLPPARLLLVGDSVDHDNAGAKAAGWDAVLVGAGCTPGPLPEARVPMSLPVSSPPRAAPCPISP